MLCFETGTCEQDYAVYVCYPVSASPPLTAPVAVSVSPARGVRGQGAPRACLPQYTDASSRLIVRDRLMYSHAKEWLPMIYAGVGHSEDMDITLLE